MQPIHRLLPVLLLALLTVSFCRAQQREPGIKEIENFVDKIPNINAGSAKDLAATLSAYGYRKEAGLRGCFYWMMKNLKYDYKDTIFIAENHHDHSSIIRNVLSGRGTICFGYALLFNRLAQELGFQSYVVTGYTAYNEKDDLNGHAWVAVKLDKGWYMFDPTWGQRSVSSVGSADSIAYSYFKVKPDVFVKDHIPFDPMWQFQDPPVSHKQFNTLTDAGSKRPFRFEDSLVKHFARNDRQQKMAELRRILDDEYINPILADYIYVLESYCNDRMATNWIEDLVKKQTKYAEAEDLFSEAYGHGVMAVHVFKYDKTASQAGREYKRKQFHTYIDSAIVCAKASLDRMDDIVKNGGAWKPYLERKQQYFRRVYFSYLREKEDYPSE